MWNRPLTTLGVVFLLTAVYHALYHPPLFIFPPAALGVGLIAVDLEVQNLKKRLKQIEVAPSVPEPEEV